MKPAGHITGRNRIVDDPVVEDPFDHNQRESVMQILRTIRFELGLIIIAALAALTL